MKIRTSNLILSFPCLDDEAAIKDFELRNRKHLKTWESPLDEAANQRLTTWISECETKRSARFIIRLKEHSPIIGFCNFTQIIQGAFQACYLGYKIDFEHEGRGLMQEALESAIPYIFEHLNLHRIMANYMPANIRSAKLLNRLGFVIEGFAKNYLLINNKWEDHVLTALSYEQWLISRSRLN